MDRRKQKHWQNKICCLESLVIHCSGHSPCETTLYSNGKFQKINQNIAGNILDNYQLSVCMRELQQRIRFRR